MKYKLIWTSLLALLFALPLASAVTITATIGSYDTSVYKNSQVVVPVSVQVQNGTGTATITINPQSGLSCTTCTNTLTYSSSETKSTQFTLSADNTGTYPSPFTITASITGATPDSKTASNTIVVNEIPSWALDFTGSASSVVAGSSVDLTLAVTTTTTFEGVTASLSLPSGWSITSGSATYNLGTVAGASQALWTVAAGSPASSNSISVTVASTNPVKSEAKTLSISGPSSSPPGGTTSGDSGAGGAGGASSQEKNVTHKVLPPGLLNNTKLQAAIGKVLAKGQLNQNAIQNLVRLSNMISGQSDVSRTMSVSGATSAVTTKVKYRGSKAAKNYIIYEVVPKAFANSSDLITVSAPGATIEVVEKDPEYAIMFDTVSPDQELSVTYTVNSAVSTSAVDSFATEVYAESLAEDEQAPEVCAQVITPARNPSTGECKEFPTPCDIPAGWTAVDSCEQAGEATPEEGGKSESKAIYYVLILAVLAAAGYYLYHKGFLTSKKLESIVGRKVN